VRSLLLTGDPDVGLLALLGPRGAPGDALAPELVQAEDLLHLLPRDVDGHLHDGQRCRAQGPGRGHVVCKPTKNPKADRL